MEEGKMSEQQPRTFYFRKLVRDRTVPEYQQDSSVVGMSHKKLFGVSLVHELIAKIHEEADEVPVVENPNEAELREIIAEIADLEDVIAALKSYYGVTDTMTADASAAKATKRGTFEQGDYIESITVMPHSQWERYCLADPNKYPEG